MARLHMYTGYNTHTLCGLFVLFSVFRDSFEILINVSSFWGIKGTTAVNQLRRNQAGKHSFMKARLTWGTGRKSLSLTCSNCVFRRFSQ